MSPSVEVKSNLFVVSACSVVVVVVDGVGVVVVVALSVVIVVDDVDRLYSDFVVEFSSVVWPESREEVTSYSFIIPSRLSSSVVVASFVEAS